MRENNFEGMFGMTEKSVENRTNRRRTPVFAFWTTLLVLGFVLGLAPAISQSSAVMDGILEEEQITYGSAAYLLLLAQDEISEDATPSEAVARMAQLGIGLDGRTANEPLTLGEYSLLTMRSFGIGGGLMYSVAPGPRYAARELAFRQVIQGHDYPGMRLSGERGLRILGRVLSLQEGGAL